MQQRIEAAPPAVRAAYAEVLRCWVREGKPPAADIARKSLLEALRALDALVLDDDGIGCYPFSARARGIHVHFVDHSRQTVDAMCALDALAIPRLSRHASQITAACVNCLCQISIDVEANGSLEHSNSCGTRVWWRRVTRNAEQSCDGLCTGIEFLCRDCALPAAALSFTLPEAAAMANAFFAFQRRLLDQ